MGNDRDSEVNDGRSPVMTTTIEHEAVCWACGWQASPRETLEQAERDQASHDCPMAAKDEQIFGASAISQPGYLREQERLNREALDRAEKVHEGPMIELAPNASGLAIPLREKFEDMTAKDLREHTKRGSATTARSLSGAVEVASESLSRQMIAKRDVATIDAISERLGTDEWTVRELRNRLLFQIQEGVTTVILDGEPLMTIYPPEFEVRKDGPSTYLTAKQKIWRQNEADQE